MTVVQFVTHFSIMELRDVEEAGAPREGRLDQCSCFGTFSGVCRWHLYFWGQ